MSEVEVNELRELKILTIWEAEAFMDKSHEPEFGKMMNIWATLDGHEPPVHLGHYYTMKAILDLDQLVGWKACDAIEWLRKEKKAQGKLFDLIN